MTHTTPKTRRQLEAHPAVEAVEHTGDPDAPWWIYLADGWYAANDPLEGSQCGSGRTLRDAINDTFPVRSTRQ